MEGTTPIMSFDELESIRLVVSEFGEEKNKVCIKNENLRKEICCLNSDINELKGINDKLCDDLEQSDKCIRKLKHENRKLEEWLQLKEDELCQSQELHDKVEKLKRCMCELYNDLDIVTKRRCSLEGHVAELNRYIKDKDLEIRRLEKNIDFLENTIRELEQTIKSVTEEIRDLKCQIEERRNCLDMTNRELDCMSQQLRQSEREKEKLQLQVQKLQHCLDEMNKELQKEMQSNAKLKDRVKWLQEESQKLSMDNAYLKEEDCNLKKKLDACNKKLKDSQCEYERELAEFEEFKKSIGKFKKQIVMETNNNSPSIPCLYPTKPDFNYIPKPDFGIPPVRSTFPRRARSSYPRRRTIGAARKPRSHSCVGGSCYGGLSSMRSPMRGNSTSMERALASALENTLSKMCLAGGRLPRPMRYTTPLFTANTPMPKYRGYNKNFY